MICQKLPLPFFCECFCQGIIQDNDISKIPSRLGGSKWRELHEALIFENQEKGKKLWSIMKGVNSNYVGEFPSLIDERQAFLNRFRSRRELQMEWLLKELAVIPKVSEDALNILSSLTYHCRLHDSMIQRHS